MRIDKSIKYGVISSIIATFIFLYLLEPILHILSSLLFFASNKISSLFIDRLYQEIAAGKSDYSLTQMVLFISLIGIISTRILIKPIRREQAQDEDKIENEKPKKDKVKLKSKLLRLSLLVLIWLVLTLQLVSSHIKISTINTFDQYIKILTPYIDQGEKDILVSKFSSMQSYNDYEKIMAEIDRKSKENGVKLPPQKIKMGSGLEI